MSSTSKQLVLASLLAATGICLSLFESTLPLPAYFPGAKIGLANIITLLCLYLLPLKTTITVLFLRLFIVALLTGTLAAASFFISLAGALASLVTMLVAKKIPRLSIIGISLLGAAAHNSGQLLAACLLINSPALFYYLPLLILFAIPAGFVTGITAKTALSTIKNKLPIE